MSQVLAVLLGLLGLATFNLFMVAIAFFIWIAVKAEAQFATVEKALENVAVRDLMSDDPVTVRAGMTVEALTRHMFTRKHVFFPVVSDEGELIGTVRLQDVDDAEPTARVEDVMSRDVATIGLHAGAAEAFKRINESAGRRLIVVGPDGEMVGIVSTTDLLRAVQIRMAQDG